MTTDPQIEPVTDEDTRVATQSYFINIKRILEQDRRRVAERRADATAVLDLLVKEKRKSEALEAEVARLTAALNGKENSDA